MFRNVKLFALLLGLLLAGVALASAKGPLADLVMKNGSRPATGFETDRNYVRPEVNPLDDIVISEGFEAYAVGSLPPGWTQVDVDGGASPVPGFAGFSRWIVFGGTGWPAHEGINSIANAYNNGALPNNDWLILPGQNLLAPITLTYWAASQDPLYLENFEVRVSTTGTQPADFTNLISTHTNVPNTFTQYTDVLSAYAGQTFNIAFHYISVDEFLLKIDDVVLEGTLGASGAVGGIVTDTTTQGPLQGVTVTAAGHSATTAADGSFTVTGVAPGAQTVTFELAGYETEIRSDVAVVADDTVMVFVAMSPEPETNDDCDNPLAITAGAHEFSTMEATTDPTIAELPAECDEGFGLDFGADIWFAYTAPGTGNLTISTCDAATYDTRLAVYTGGNNQVPDCPTSNADFYACNDDGEGCGGFTSELTVEVAAGEVYLIRVGGFGTANGTGTVTLTEALAADDSAPALPSSLVLHSAYPNPFNPSTTLHFDMPTEGDVELRVFSVLGEEVAVLVRGMMSKGTHYVGFDGAKLSSGVYFAQLSNGTSRSTQKLILMK